MKKIAAIQSNYIPWRGYFDFIRKVDEFYLYDCVQYTPRNWRNRNCIKTKDGLQWLTIPLRHENRNERICDKVIADADWAAKHWNRIQQAYARSPYFKHYRPLIEATYLECKETHLSHINKTFLALLTQMLEISTPLILLDGYKPVNDKNEALITLCQQANANVYLTGPVTRDYIDEKKFNAAGVSVEWMEYNYPDYPQLYPPFEHKVTVLDLLFNVGPAATRYFR